MTTIGCYLMSSNILKHQTTKYVNNTTAQTHIFTRIQRVFTVYRKGRKHNSKVFIKRAHICIQCVGRGKLETITRPVHSIDRSIRSNDDPSFLNTVSQTHPTRIAYYLHSKLCYNGIVRLLLSKLYTRCVGTRVHTIIIF